MTVGTRTTTRPPSPGYAPGPALRTARATGLLYLGLALTGLVDFLLIRPQLIPGDESALASLADQESLARLAVAVELGVVLTQALAAVWFYRLFRPVDAVAAGTLAAFGLVNATMILGSAASLATALDLALDPSGDAAGQVRLLVGLSENLWGVGGLFFGLWLVPMGLLVLRVGMPRALGWVLVVGGVGYVLSTYVAYLAPGAQPVADALIIPATIGELWVVGYLIYGGVFRSPRAHVADPLPATVGA